MFAISSSVLAFVVGLLCFYQFRHDDTEHATASIHEPGRTKTKPTVSPTIESPARNTHGDPARHGDIVEELLDELEKYADSGTLLMVGDELAEVWGESIFEDPVTGIVAVVGLQRLKLFDGSEVTASDATLIYDPESGKIEIEGKAITVNQPADSI